MGSTGDSTNQVWKHEATPITAPSNRPSYNPYSGRTTNNLNHSNHSNHARNATLAPVGNSSSHDMPSRSKRKRVEPTFPRYVQPKKKHSDRPKLAPEHSDNIIYVDDDEDLGTRVGSPREASPDPLSLPPETAEKPKRPVSQWKPVIKPSEGFKLSPSSPIESADGTNDRAGSPKVPKLVKMFERNEENKIPHVNLKGKMKIKGGRAQGKMRSTFETHITLQEHIDPIATASTSYHHGGGKGKQREKQEYRLPVKEWCLGLLHFEEPCHLSFSSASQDIKIDGPSYHEELPLSLIKVLQLPAWKEASETVAYPVVKIETRAFRRENFGADFKEYFTSGEMGKGFVTFGLDATDVSWSDESWKCLKDLLKGSVTEEKNLSYHLSSANTSVWRSAEIQTRATYTGGEFIKRKRPEGLDEEDAKIGSNDSSRRTSTLSNSHSTEAKTSRSRSSNSAINTKSNPFRTPSKKVQQENQATSLRRSSRHEARTKQLFPVEPIEPIVPIEPIEPVEPIENAEEVILCYPPATAGAVNLTNADLARLKPGQYLNDTVIEFGLRLWHKELEQSSPDLADQVYIFNSFFYKKLNSKKNVEESYKTVARWTNKIDIFKKKYVIVPINENHHWYLAVIYQPEHVLLPPEEKPVPATRGRTRLSQAHNAADDIADDVPELNDRPDDQLEALTSASTSDTAIGMDDAAEALNNLSTEDDEPDMNIVATATVSLDDDLGSLTAMDCDEEDAESAASVTAHLTQVDASVVDDEDVSMRDVDDKASVLDVEETEAQEERQRSTSTIPPANFYGKPPSAREKREESELAESIASEESTPQPSTTDASKPIPYIFIMDSMGQKHQKVITGLSNYLKCEAMEKKNKEPTDITKPTGKYAQVPLQPNFSDCGLYLLHFARTFVEKTDYLVKVMTRDRSPRTPQADRNEDWNARSVEGHRQQLTERIKELSIEWKKEKAAREAEEEEERKRKEAIEIPDSDEDEMEIIQENLASKKKASRTYGSKQNSTRPARLR